MSGPIFMPRDNPSVYVATASDSSMTVSGLVTKLNSGRQSSGITPSSESSSDIAISATGSSALAKQLNVLGSSFSGRSGATNSVIGFDFTLRNSRAYSGPAQIMAGSATMRP